MSETKLTVGIIGSGAMGNGIAQVAATAGHQVIVNDSNSAQLEKAKKNLRDSLDKLVEKNKLAKEKADSIFNSVSYSDSLSSFSSCGLVIEAIVENLEVKQKVFTDLEKIVSKDCFLASNTSSLSISSIAGACTDQSRVMGIHFFNPATIMPLVEIIAGKNSSGKIVTEIRSLIDSWGKTTVLAKDSPGFIVNRVARSFYGESILIAEEKIADYATIDWAMKEFGGFKMGPFELMDFIGNDVNYAVTVAVWQQLNCDPKFQPSVTQKNLVDAKTFGRKSGKGYYDYSPGAVMPEPKKDMVLGREIFLRVISMLINEAIDTLYLGIATRDDIDTAMTKGVNYPKGLLKWCDELGIETIAAKMKSLCEQYGAGRYRLSELLKKMVGEKKKFY
ncbi:MAG TPA: 3-hydroxyacyl-CoA dehydrogenase NAD-binding domain-containing protein [Bacteroidia bacterium]|jgi:3-hydroxybutyryl-CoA dehydrogenase|nr:3-hydroxyacyl-CoA dehydrogenase NAD-binding domain-containing protein [Bacteroidia bacterium]